MVVDERNPVAEPDWALLPKFATVIGHREVALPDRPRSSPHPLALWGVDAERPMRPRRKAPGSGRRVVAMRREGITQNCLNA